MKHKDRCYQFRDKRVVMSKNKMSTNKVNVSFDLQFDIGDLCLFCSIVFSLFDITSFDQTIRTRNYRPFLQSCRSRWRVGRRRWRGWPTRLSCQTKSWPPLYKKDCCIAVVEKTYDILFISTWVCCLNINIQNPILTLISEPGFYPPFHEHYFILTSQRFCLWILYELSKNECL